jgi:hypothetical protein
MGAAALGPAGMVLGGVGMATGLVGAGFQISAEQQATQWKVAQDQVNQQLQQQQAASVLQRGALAAGMAQMQGSQVQGKAAAAFGASGVAGGVGSAAAVQGATGAMANLDAMTASNNAARQAWGYQVTANQYGAQAGIDKQNGQDQEIATALGAGGSVLGSAGKMIGNAPPGFFGG